MGGDDHRTASRIGPPPGLAEGTGWTLGGAAKGGDEVLVIETCCSLDANSYDGGEALLHVDLSSGSVSSRQQISTRSGRLAVDQTTPCS